MPKPFFRSTTTESPAVLSQGGDGGNAVEAEPRLGGGQALVHVVDVGDALLAEPLLEGLQPLLGVDGNAVFPGGAAAEHAGEVGAGLGGELERFVEGVVADAGGKIDEGLLGHAGGATEMFLGLFFRIDRFA